MAYVILFVVGIPLFAFAFSAATMLLGLFSDNFKTSGGISMKPYQIILGSLCLLALSAETRGGESKTNVVAEVFGINISAQDIGLSPDKAMACAKETGCSARTPVRKLHKRVWRKLFEDFVKQNKLQATKAEIQEFVDHQERFMEQDRKRREKELQGIKKQLKSDKLTQSQRSKLEEHKATLESLEQSDKLIKAMKFIPSVLQQKHICAPWVENWKVNKALFEKYGGMVATTKFGPDPVGARRMLIKEYAKEGKFVILHKELEKAYWEMLSKKPRYIAAPDQIDFTPYWKKPLEEETAKQVQPKKSPRKK